MQLAWPPSHTHPDEQHQPCQVTPFHSLGWITRPSTRKASWDLERVEPWIPWRAILLSVAKKPPPPATGCQAAMANPAGYSASSLRQHHGGCWRCVEHKQFLLPGSGAAQLWPLSLAAFLHLFKASCQEPQGAELCIRCCKPPTPPSEPPWPVFALRLHRGPLLPTETGAEFSLQ